MKEKEMAGFIMHADDAALYAELTRDEFYNVVYGAFNYCISGQTPDNLTHCEKIVFKQIAKRIDNDKERYEKTRAARVAAGKKSASIRYHKSPEKEKDEDEENYDDFFINIK